MPEIPARGLVKIIWGFRPSRSFAKEQQGGAGMNDFINSNVIPEFQSNLLDIVTQQMLASKPFRGTKPKHIKRRRDYEPMVMEGISFSGNLVKGNVPPIKSLRKGASYRIGTISMSVLSNYWGEVFQWHDRGTKVSEGRYVPTDKPSPNRGDGNPVGFRSRTGAQKRPVRRRITTRADVQKIINERKKVLSDPFKTKFNDALTSHQRNAKAARRKKPRSRTTEEVLSLVDRGPLADVRSTKNTHPGFPAKDFTKKFIDTNYGTEESSNIQKLFSNSVVAQTQIINDYGTGIAQAVIDKITKDLVKGGT